LRFLHCSHRIEIFVKQDNTITERPLPLTTLPELMVVARQIHHRHRGDLRSSASGAETQKQRIGCDKQCRAATAAGRRESHTGEELRVGPRQVVTTFVFGAGNQDCARRIVSVAGVLQGKGETELHRLRRVRPSIPKMVGDINPGFRRVEEPRALNAKARAIKVRDDFDAVTCSSTEDVSQREFPGRIKRFWEN
jgi:hypothetical protein